MKLDPAAAFPNITATLLDTRFLKGTDLAALNITPVPKVLFIDVLKDVYKVDATLTIKDVIAEKPEALAWGPDVAQQLPAPMFPPGLVNQALKLTARDGARG